MARPTTKNSRKSLFGKKLDSLMGNSILIEFCKCFGVSSSTYSKYLSGDTSPSMDKLRDFVLNYAATHDMKMIDLNWLVNDSDRRIQPVFLGEQANKFAPTGAGADDLTTRLFSTLAEAYGALSDVAAEVKRGNLLPDEALQAVEEALDILMKVHNTGEKSGMRKSSS